MEVQPIEFIIDTGSPVTLIPPIINQKELNETTKLFVDVNKNPVKFEGDAMVKIKSEKNTEVILILVSETKTHSQ